MGRKKCDQDDLQVNQLVERNIELIKAFKNLQQQLCNGPTDDTRSENIERLLPLENYNTNKNKST